MMETGKRLLPHIGALLVLLVISLTYFSPVLSGRVIVQSDIIQYLGMAEERNSLKEETGEESYWTNAAFGGMPTYQLGANYPHNYIKKLDKLIRFLPRPADYLFLYFAGFYVLMLTMRVPIRWAVAGSLLFGLTTYYLIIIEVGHNAKAHAIGYMPLVLAGVLLVFRRKWLGGALLTTLALGLEIAANHYQMTYYLGFAVGLLVVFKAIEMYRRKAMREYAGMLGVLLGSLFLAIGLNATSLMATSEYTRWSTRGPSEINLGTEGEVGRSGLSYEYITEYSYGIFETLNLIVPGLTGGSNSERAGEDSATYEYLRDIGASRSQALEFVENLPLYWGDQPIVAAPAYVGAVVFFCFLLGAFLLRNNYRWWLISTAVLGIMLSWGKNFEWLTRFFIDFVPLYDKFRAVSSVQVITELSMAALAVLGVYEFAKNPRSPRSIRALYLAFGSSLGILLLLFLLKGSLGFEGSNDFYYSQYGAEFIDALIEDRKSLFTRDLWRSLLLVVCTGLLFLLYRRLGWKPLVLLFGWAALVLFDLWGIGRRYVNEESFDNPLRMERPFRKSELDKQLIAEPGYFRVYNEFEGLRGASTSYFHKSIGGYHAAKPQTLQNLFDYHIQPAAGAPINVEPLRMLNVKFWIRPTEEGGATVETPGPYGNAWFVENIVEVEDQTEALFRLDSTVANTSALWVPEGEIRPSRTKFQLPPENSIEWAPPYRPDRLTYKVNNPQDGFAVFSEMWYPKGWKAFIDGQEAPIFRVNYFLRGLEIPGGTQKVELIFDPTVVRRGSRISLMASLVFAGLLIYALVNYIRREREMSTL